MLPENEDAVVWSIRIPVLAFTAAVEALIDGTYQMAVLDTNHEEWARFLPAYGSLPDAIDKLQMMVNGVVDEYVVRQRLGFPT